MPKNDRKQLRLLDAIGTLRERFTPAREFCADRTAVLLAGYFREGGSALRYDVIVDYSIAVLAGHRTEEATIKIFDTFEYEPMRVEGKQVLRAIISAYGKGVTSCVKVPEKWVRVRGGLGIWLPQAMLVRIHGARRFIIIQPRRDCEAIRIRPSILLSTFNLHHAVDDERNTFVEALDLQCAKGLSVRPKRLYRTEDYVRLTKKELDSVFSVYADAMELILKEPVRYGIEPGWAEAAQEEFEFRW